LLVQVEDIGPHHKSQKAQQGGLGLEACRSVYHWLVPSFLHLSDDLSSHPYQLDQRLPAGHLSARVETFHLVPLHF